MNNKYTRSYRRLISRAVVIVLLCVLFFQLSDYLPGFSQFDQSWIDAQTRHAGIEGILRYVIVATLLLSVGMPRQMIAFLGGYAFGTAEGVVFSTLAATTSCALTFCAARYFSKPFVLGRFERKVKKVEGFLLVSPLLMTIVIRLLPVGNNLLTNIIVGVTCVPASRFILGSGIGYIPQMLIFSLMGKGVVVESTIQVSISAVLMVISGIIGYVLLRQYRADKLNDAQSESCCGCPLENGKNANG